MPIDIADVAEVIYYTEDSVSPLTVLKPAAFAAGQLLALVIADDTGVLADLTGPAGWASQGSWSNSGASCYAKLWTHPYNAADPSTWDFGYNAGASVAAALVRITGAESTPTVVLTAGNTGPTAGTADSPTLTPSGINDLLIVVLGCTGAGTALLETDPAGTNNLGQAQVVGNFMALALASQQLTDGSAIGTQTWTAITPANNAGGTLSVAFKSTGFLDPDPPLRPPGAEIPPWLLRELVASKQQPKLGGTRVPVVKQYLSGGASGASVTLTTAATTDATDLLVCFHGNDFDQAANMGTPTGTAGTWTQQALGDGGTNGAHLKIWTRPAAAGANTVTCAPTPSAEEITVHLFVISGADLAGGPVDVAAGGNGTASTSHVAPTLDPASFNCLLLSGVHTGSSGAANYTAPPGMIKQGEVDVGGFCTSATALQVLGNDQPTGTRTFTSTVSDVFAAASIAITPAAVSGAAAITLTDSGAGTDVLAVAVAAPTAETGAGADTADVAVALAVADSGAGSESVAVAIPITVADAGVAGDVLAVAATVPAPDSAAGTDTAVVAVTLPLPDGGAAADVLAAGVPVTVADTGAGTDVLAAVAAVPAADTGAGTDAVAVAATAPTPDTGAGLDTAAVSAATPLTEAGAGTDTVAALVGPPLSDTAAGTDTTIVAAAVPLPDTGTGSDTVTTTAAVAFASTGTGADTLAAGTGVAVADQGAATDTTAVATAVAVSDAATAAETLQAAATSPLPDAGAGVDTVGVVVARTTTDAGSAADSLTVVVGLPLADSSSGSDVLTVLVALAVTDSAAAVDMLVGGPPPPSYTARMFDSTTAVSAGREGTTRAGGADTGTTRISGTG